MRIVKQISRKFGVALAALMVLSVFLSAGVFGAQKSITVNGPEGADMTGLTLTAYKVLNEDSDGGYVVESAFTNFFLGAETAYESLSSEDTLYLSFSNNALTLSADTTGLTDYITIRDAGSIDDKYFAASLLEKCSNAADTRTLSNWLVEYVNAQGFTGLNTGTVQLTGATSTLTINSEPLNGYYLLATSGNAAGITVQNSILNIVDATQPATVTLKAEQYPLEKTVDKPSASVGDTLEYTITSKVPDTDVYTQLEKFELSDIMVNQDLANSFTMTIGEEATTNVTYAPNANDSPYAGGTFKVGGTTIATLTINRAPGDPVVAANDAFTIDFVESALATYSGQKLTLTYSTTLNANAVHVNGNDVTLDITNGPNENTSISTDHTDVYTYGMNLTKTFSDDADLFGNVSFKVYNTDPTGGGATPMNFTGSAGNYQYAATEVVGTTTQDVAVDTQNGTLSLDGLAEGTYYLVENKPEALADYRDVTVVVTLADINDDGSLDILANNNGGSTATIEGKNVVDSQQFTLEGNQNVSINFTVLNQKVGFSIPNTGAMGTTLLTLGGIVLIVAAAGALVIARRKSAK